MLISDSELQKLIDAGSVIKVHKTEIIRDVFLITAFVDDGELFDFALPRASKAHNVEKALQLRGVCKKLKYTVR
jgi:hypothetical protein